MALYAFDGTGNSDEESPGQDTNVVKFLDYYSAPPGHEEYIAGVGTRFRLLGKMVGGLTGAGGHERVQEMVEKFDANWKEGDKKVDVIGFSRGSALALDFCNRLAAGVTVDARTVRPDIRFLGLWDTVAAFGAPGLIFEKAQTTNMGHKLTIPKNVQHCFHAMALDERRGAFMISRLDPEHDDTDRITEVWFSGVHSDVGGGNENVARSDIALAWMIENAINTGLPIDRSKLATLKAEIDPFAAVSSNTDLVLDPPRIVDPRDSVHESAKGTLLTIGERKKLFVNSTAWQNWTGVEVVKGSRYRFHIDQTQRWEDASIACSPSGWSEDEIESIGFWKRIGIKIVGTVKKRCQSANWFEVVCSIGAHDEHLVAIGSGRYSKADWVAPASGPLFAFANDAEKTFGKDFYKNNKGSVGFEIERVG